MGCSVCRGEHAAHAGSASQKAPVLRGKNSTQAHKHTTLHRRQVTLQAASGICDINGTYSRHRMHRHATCRLKFVKDSAQPRAHTWALAGSGAAVVLAGGGIPYTGQQRHYVGTRALGHLSRVTSPLAMPGHAANHFLPGCSANKKIATADSPIQPHWHATCSLNQALQYSPPRPCGLMPQLYLHTPPAVPP